MNEATFFNISYGLYIVSSKKGKEINGQVANAVFQVTPDPITVAVSIAKQNLTHEFIEESKVFSVSILSEDWTMKEIGNFGFKSGRDIDKFYDCQFKLGKNGAPYVLDKTIGYFECDVINSLDAGSHTIFLGRVTDAEILQQGKPMTYDYYHKVLRGKEPKNAAAYIKETEVKKEEKKAEKYRCVVCGYIYDPAENNNVAFADLPAGWVCPVCGVGKDKFELI